MKFDYDEEPLHQYQSGVLRMIRGKETRSFSYEISFHDTLIHRNTKRKTFEKFIILKLDEDHLVLKREMKPIFKGENQERYEIKYFSKVK